MSERRFEYVVVFLVVQGKEDTILDLFYSRLKT